MNQKENEKMNENQATNQATNQASQKNQAAAKYAEAKTVINGQEVKVKEAQAAEEAFNKQNTQTGIQAHHDNSSEAVQAGQTAQNAATMNQQTNAAVKQVDVQSGQQHLEQHMQSGAQSQAQMKAQEDHQTMQQSIDAKAKAKAKKAD
jgi:SWI/SNF chromatin-remodeling complex subunit SWI1